MNSYKRGLIAHWDGGQVIQGDSRELIKSIASNSVRLIFTDPPYGNENRGGEDFISLVIANMHRGKATEEDVRTIKNDDSIAHRLFQDMLPHYVRVLKPGGVLCICGPGGGGPGFGEGPIFARWASWLDATPGLQYKQLVVWDKIIAGFGWHFRRCNEHIHVAVKDGAPCKWHIGNMREEAGMRMFRNIQQISYKPPKKDEHPTPKPIALIEKFIAIFTNPRESVLDCFAGGGSTGVAAVNLDRQFLGFELDDHWVKYANNRIDAVINCIDRKANEQGQLGLFAPKESKP